MSTTFCMNWWMSRDLVGFVDNPCQSRRWYTKGISIPFSFRRHKYWPGTNAKSDTGEWYHFTIVSLNKHFSNFIYLWWNETVETTPWLAVLTAIHCKKRAIGQFDPSKNNKFLLFSSEHLIADLLNHQLSPAQQLGCFTRYCTILQYYF